MPTQTPHPRGGPRRIGVARRDAIAVDTRPMAYAIARLARKHGVACHTIARHALLLAVPLHRGQV